MNIGKKLIAGFVTLGSIISLVALVLVIRIESEINPVRQFHGPALQKIQALEAFTKGAVQESYAYLVSGDVREKNEFLEWAETFDAEAEIFINLARLEETGESKEKALFEKIRIMQKGVIEQATRLFEEYETKGFVDRERFLAYENSINALESAIQVLVRFEMQEFEEAQQRSLLVISQTEGSLFWLALLGVGVAFALGYFMARGIKRRIGRLATGAEKIGRGEFETRVEIGPSDEIGILGKAVNNMALQLQDKFDQNQQLVNLKQIKLDLEREIWERKEAEAALKKLEEKYEDLYQNAPDMFLSVDARTGIILECNQTLIMTTGFSKDEIIGKPVSSLYDPADRSKVQQALEQFRLTGEVRDLDLQLLRNNGGARNVLVNASAVRDEEGHILRTRSILRDVTEQKQTIVSLKESEQRFRELAENLKDVVWVMSSDFSKVLYVNASFEEIWGASRESLYQNPDFWMNAVHPDDRERVEAAFHAMRDRGTFDEEYKIILSDGAIRWIHDRGRQINNQQGEPYRIVGIAEDITQRKLAERALQASEERYRKLVDVAPICIHEFDTEMKLLSMNPAGLRMLGLNNENQIYGKSLDQFLLESEQETILAFVGKALHGIPTEFDHTAVVGNDVKTLHQKLTPILGSDGRLEKLLGLTEDITERKRTEQDLRRVIQETRLLSLQVAKTQEEERTRIARELHDEFGQGLTALNFDLSWVSKRMGKEGDLNHQQEISQKLQSMARQVIDIIQAVRRIASSLRPSILDDLGLVEALESESRDFEERTGILCQVEIASGVRSQDIESDVATALYRISKECLTNVIRHAEASRVKVTLSQDAQSLVLEMSDDGKGISDSQIKSAHSLGVLGMRERAMALGGELRVSRNVEKGTQVIARFPKQILT